jgi:RNA polymerase sigma-70 factor (ECF subfamily)
VETSCTAGGPEDSSPTSDIALMLRVQAGDELAFAEIVYRHQKMLLNFFRRMGAYTGEAEDLVQETFLRLFAYRAKYRPTGKFTALLFTLARHAWADGLRKKRREPSPCGAAGVRSSGEGPSDAGSDSGGEARHVERADARFDAARALAELSEKLRPVVVLSICQGLDHREIAEILGIPVGTVKSRLHTALGQLREAMRVWERDGGGRAREGSG